MLCLDLFLVLLILSTVVKVVLSEFMKKLLRATDTPYRNNVVVWLCSMTACTGAGVVYRIPFGLGFEVIQVARLLALIVMTWLLSMALYDRTLQTIRQHKKYMKNKRDKIK